MKKIRIIIFMLIILLCGATEIFASNPTVQFKGNSEVTEEETNTLTIEVSNDEAVGVIEGKISCDSSIKDIKINPSYNGWTATYNETTGKFNAFKAEGATKEEALEITYKLDKGATKGKISVSDIELTTISYNTLNLDKSVSQTIIKKGSSQTANDTNFISKNLFFIVIVIIIVVVIITIMLKKKKKHHKR